MTTKADREADRRDDAAAWRRAYRDGLPEGSAGCPGEDELAALVVGEIGADARLRLADHVVSCRRCAAAYQALVELHEEATGAAPASTAADVRRPRRRLLGWAAAAAVLLAAGLVIVELPRADRDREVVRGSSDAARAVEPPHGARLSASPRRFVWAAEGPGAIYRVVVYDVESAPLWESDRTQQTRVELPVAIRERLAAGGTFYWRVRVEGERGRSATPLYRFEVAR